MLATIQNIYEVFRQNPLICNDTRNILPGCIYWAIKGERFDGNTFTAQALENGAAYAVIDNEDFKINDKCLLVEDSLKALQDLATYHRQQLQIPIIAITGSNGKTTSKELLYRTLSTKYNTFATPGNLNNHIGLPLSLLKISGEHEVAVIELGANHQEENAFLCEICLPDYGIITNIGKDHLEGFGGIEGVEKAQIELFDFLKKNKGLAFVNADDERIIKHLEGLKTFSYGTGNKTEITGKIKARFPFVLAEITDIAGKETIEIQSHLFGSFHLYNILAAASIGKVFGVNLQQVKKAVEDYIPANNRSQILKKDDNIFILDAYNANPSSMSGALADFTDYPAENKILILGDMFEMGEESEQEHLAIVKQIKADNFKQIVLVGTEFAKHAAEIPKADFLHNSEQLKEWYNKNTWQNTVFYLKGSRGMKLERMLE